MEKPLHRCLINKRTDLLDTERTNWVLRLCQPVQQTMTNFLKCQGTSKFDQVSSIVNKVRGVPYPQYIQALKWFHGVTENSGKWNRKSKCFVSLSFFFVLRCDYFLFLMQIVVVLLSSIGEAAMTLINAKFEVRGVIIKSNKSNLHCMFSFLYTPMIYAW